MAVRSCLTISAVHLVKTIWYFSSRGFTLFSAIQHKCKRSVNNNLKKNNHNKNKHETKTKTNERTNKQSHYNVWTSSLQNLEHSTNKYNFINENKYQQQQQQLQNKTKTKTKTKTKNKTKQKTKNKKQKTKQNKTKNRQKGKCNTTVWDTCKSSFKTHQRSENMFWTFLMARK